MLLTSVFSYIVIPVLIAQASRMRRWRRDKQPPMPRWRRWARGRSPRCWPLWCAVRVPGYGDPKAAAGNSRRLRYRSDPGVLRLALAYWLTGESGESYSEAFPSSALNGVSNLSELAVRRRPAVMLRVV